MTTNPDIAEMIRTKSNDQLDLILTENHALANGKTAQGISFLLFAAYCRNNRAVELIKKYKQQLDIYEAASTGETAIAQKIISESPGLIDTPSVDGFSPLGLSCFFGHYEIARFLIEKGADVNQASNNSFKVAPIHSACAISDDAIAELLLKNGADPNATQQAGVTPLHEAAHNGKTSLAKMLIDYKANVNAKMDSGQTPLAMALEKSFMETAALIRQHGGQ